MVHAANPASHPELLNVLADSLLKHDYNVRYLLREIALTNTYQRASEHQGKSDKGYSAALLKPLSPEQLAWAMMQATGALNSEPPAPTKQPADTECEPVDTVRVHVEEFAKVFSSGGQSTRFDAAAGQALFLRNGNLIQSWVSSSNGLAASLQPLDNRRAAEELYLAIFSRQPTAKESKRVTQYLQSHQDRAAALRQLVWAALVSSEFRFNH